MKEMERKKLPKTKQKQAILQKKLFWHKQIMRSPTVVTKTKVNLRPTL